MLRRLVTFPPDQPSPLRGPLSGEKQLTWSGSIPLEPVRSTGRAHGATVHDLALAAVTGAPGRHLNGRDVEVRRVSAAIPLNLRSGDRPFDARRGKQFGLAFVPLPVDEPRPVERLRRVKAAMDEAKRSGEGRAVHRALAVLGHSICSYAGQLTLGVSVDTALVPDADELLRSLSDEVAALRELADPVHAGT